ncbi:hypothetical protein [Nocardia sp. NPDC051750]
MYDNTVAPRYDDVKKLTYSEAINDFLGKIEGINLIATQKILHVIMADE